jgi:sterol desaturase/sphingolipid hydroxylase (fatty acid hydroxylase superfamily)
MSFLRRRKKDDALLPQSTDSMQIQKDMEEKEAWRAKPRVEKLRLARIEQRRRKQKRQKNPFSLQFWTWRRVVLLLLGLLLLWLLPVLLSQHKTQRLKGFRTHGGSWAARMEGMLEDAIGL